MPQVTYKSLVKEAEDVVQDVLKVHDKLRQFIEKMHSKKDEDAIEELRKKLQG